MTINNNREFIAASLKRFGIEDTDIDLIVAEHPDVDPEGPIDPEKCKSAMYESMSAILPGVCRNVTEGGYSESWNIEGIKMWYASLAAELGRDDVLSVKRPAIRNRSNVW